MQVDLSAVDEMTDAAEEFWDQRKSRGSSFQAVDLDAIDETLGSIVVDKKSSVDDDRTAEGVYIVIALAS